MTQDELKTLVGQAAVQYVPAGAIVGVGTGSTVNKFIDALAAIKDRIRGAVSSSVASTERLKALGIPVLEASEVESLPVYIEVIPMAAVQVARRLKAQYGGEATLRAGCVTDNGCHILDVRGLKITDPAAMEADISQWPGVVTVGIFARNKASVCLLGTSEGVRTLTF